MLTCLGLFRAYLHSYNTHVNPKEIRILDYHLSCPAMVKKKKKKRKKEKIKDVFCPIQVLYLMTKNIISQVIAYQKKKLNASTLTPKITDKRLGTNLVFFDTRTQIQFHRPNLAPNPSTVLKTTAYNFF